MTREEKNKLVKNYKHFTKVGWIAIASFFIFLALIAFMNSMFGIYAILCFLSFFISIICAGISSSCMTRLYKYKYNLLHKKEAFILNLAISQLIENPVEYYEKHRHLIKIIKSDIYRNLIMGMVITSYLKSGNEYLVKKAEEVLSNIKKW